MIKVDISLVRPGMQTARPIYNEDGKLLIDKGVKLKENYIHKLIRMGISEIFVEWEKIDQNDIMKAVSDKTKIEVLKYVQETLDKIYTKNNTEQINTEREKLLVTEIIEGLLTKKSVLQQLTDIWAIDYYTFGHCINVCILSLRMGIGCNYSKNKLEKLGMGAILHDIGKIHITKNILNKPSTLNLIEYEEMKNHTIIGSEMIKNIEGVCEEVYLIVRNHHERYDGRGYPDQIKAGEIHEFCRIVAICDVYDALTSNRVYKKKISPQQAVEYLISMGDQQFDYELIQVFLKYINGTLINLEFNEKGIADKHSEDWPKRSVVEAKNNPSIKHIENSKKMNLEEHLNNCILSEEEAI